MSPSIIILFPFCLVGNIPIDKKRKATKSLPSNIFISSCSLARLRQDFTKKMKLKRTGLVSISTIKNGSCNIPGRETDSVEEGQNLVVR